MNNKYSKALKAAFPLTLPICAAFLFLGISYGFYICSKGFSPWYPFFTSALVFAGSMEFVLVTMLLSPFNPLYCFFMALMINSRHLFYGLSMLEKYKNTGLKKFYLIFGMCDESFAINCNTVIPEGIDKGCFMVCVNLLNQIYWVAGATIGGLLGNKPANQYQRPGFCPRRSLYGNFRQPVAIDRKSHSCCFRHCHSVALPGAHRSAKLYSAGHAASVAGIYHCLLQRGH